MNKVVIPTGYMGSGSSAITDLMQEFRGYEFSRGSFEYIFMHCPDGVFDLEDKLLVGNNAVRSDEAIHSFHKCMEELYSRKFWWPGNYKKNLHPDFMEITEEYIRELVQYEPSDYWYMQEKLTFPMLIMMLLRKILLLASAGKIAIKRPLLYPQMKLSLVNSKEFYRMTRKYLERIFDCMGLQERNLVLDQMLLPFNLWRMEHYFGDNTECFVVERDPRDVFISNKYIWGKRDNNPVPYPTDAEIYCGYYKRLRSMEKKVDNPHVHRFHFEDLIYHYEESVKRICRVLSLDKSDHIARQKYFNPELSIYNTQLFLKKEYQREMAIIEKELPEFLYDFPYVHSTDMEKVF